MGHKWSGWPGAYCLKCGAGDVAEVALADGWIDFVEDKNNPNGMRMVYKSEVHKELIELCNNNCSADMTEDEFAKIQERAKELEDVINK